MNVPQAKIIIHAKITISQAKIELFKPIALNIVEKTRSEKGSISYVCTQSLENECVFIFVEEWANDEAIASHFKSEHFTEFVGKLKDFSEKSAEIYRYDVSGITKL